MCKQHYTVNYQAEHQIVLEVYKDIQALYLRGYIIAQLSYMILGLREKGMFKNRLCGRCIYIVNFAPPPPHKEQIDPNKQYNIHFDSADAMAHLIFI